MEIVLIVLLLQPASLQLRLIAPCQAVGKGGSRAPRIIGLVYSMHN